jgi:hypothetical protein
MAPTGGSRQRGRMPAMEAEADGRRTQLGPPLLTRSGPVGPVRPAAGCERSLCPLTDPCQFDILCSAKRSSG